MNIVLDYTERQKYIIDVTLVMECEKEVPFYLQLASWRPGRYELANFAQYLYPLHSENASIKKVTKDKWEISPKEDNVTVQYKFYANQPDAGGSLINEDFIYLNPINFIPKIKGYEGSYELEINAPEEYTIATSLEKKGSLLSASSYEELIDSPVIASSTIQHKSYHIEDSEFHIWIQGNLNPDWDTILAHFESFTKEQIELFGSFPSEHYHFLNLIHPFKAYHGVEHLNSTVIVLGPDTEFNSKKMQLNFLGISSHELFHFWNIKRIKPQELIGLDLSSETYFDTGLIAEGLTTYYGDYILGRTGVLSQQEFFDEINTYLQRHFQNFGRTANSVAESSIDLWLDGYKLGIPDRKVSIYIKGALISLIFDLEIRKASNHRHSLDDVMRRLWSSFGDSRTGYSMAFYRNIILTFLPEGADLFDHLVFGKGPILSYLKTAFQFIGCGIELVKNENQLLAKYGFLIHPENHQVYKVDPKSSQQLVVSDKIKTINNNPFDKELKAYPEKIKVVIERYGREKTFDFKASENDFFKEYRIVQNVSKGPAFENFCKWLPTLK